MINSFIGTVVIVDREVELWCRFFTLDFSHFPPILSANLSIPSEQLRKAISVAVQEVRMSESNVQMI